MEPFSITCTTCRARLKVRDAAAVGHILACPKCHSMVQVTAPPGWQPPVGSTTEVMTGPLTPPPIERLAETPLAEKSRPWRSDSDAATGDLTAPLAGSAAAIVPLATSGTPPLDAAVPVAGAGMPAWMPWACVPLAGLASGLAVWFALGDSAAEPEPAQPPVAVVAPEKPRAPAIEQPAEPPKPIAQPARPVPIQWLSPGAQEVLSLRLASLQEQPAVQAIMLRESPLWLPLVGSFYMAFGLHAGEVERLTWSTTDLAAPGAHFVLISELVHPIADPAKSPKKFELLPEKLASHAVYRAVGSWTQPFLLVDGKTIVSGPLDVLQEVVARGETPLKNSALEQLIQRDRGSSSMLLAVDMAAWRQRPMSQTWLELWGVSRQDWGQLRERPLAAALSLVVDQRLAGELALVCESKSIAEQTHEALQHVAAALEIAFQDENKALSKNMLSTPMTTATADQLDLLLTSGVTALGNRQSGVDETITWARAHWQGDLRALGIAAITSVPALELSRLASARAFDEHNQRRLLIGLAGCAKKEGGFPAGAGGSALLPPETRLSWIATMLPYYDYFEWHGSLNFAQPWNSVENRRITSRPLDPVINPSLGLSLTDAGFSVTHYVGLAGLGTDAATLESQDPRAGVFGYQRRTPPERIPDGASNTIALMGVSSRLGPWASGGEATVRPLTAPPYVNGPDGFGSGQPDGMFVGMADGSVRFIAKDIDRSVLEQLATIHGDKSHEPAAPAKPPLAVAKIEPPPAPPEKTALPDADKPPLVDVAARLTDKLAGIDFRQQKVALAGFVELLTNLTTVPISFDPDALLETGVRLEDPIAVSKQDTTYGEVLRDVLSEHGLDYVVLNGQVVITTPEDHRTQFQTARYDVRDLGDPQVLTGWLRQFVEPPSWDKAGGRATIKIDKTHFVIDQTPAVHHRIAVFLDKLRVARNSSPRSGIDPQLARLESRYALADGLLNRNVIANFRQPAPLGRILQELHDQTGALLMINGPALAAASRSPISGTSLVVEKQSLAVALNELLRPLGLAFRVVDARMVEITSAAAVKARLELEIYHVADLLLGKTTGETLAARITNEVAPTTWSDTGGAGAIGYDSVSSSLLILQTQAVQHELEQRLDAWRKTIAQKAQ